MNHLIRPRLAASEQDLHGGGPQDIGLAFHGGRLRTSPGAIHTLMLYVEQCTNRCVVRVRQFAPLFGSIYDTMMMIARSRS
jgi:hypothetical protein